MAEQQQAGDGRRRRARTATLCLVLLRNAFLSFLLVASTFHLLSLQFRLARHATGGGGGGGEGTLITWGALTPRDDGDIAPGDVEGWAAEALGDVPIPTTKKDADAGAGAAASAMAATTTSATTNVQNNDDGRAPPLLPQISANSAHSTQPHRRQKVYILPQTPPTPHKAGEYKHFIRDAVTRSNLLHETTDPNDVDAVWIVEVIRCKCWELTPLVTNSTQKRLEALQKSETSNMKLTLKDVPGWNIYLIDYNDSGYVPVTDCARQLTNLLGSKRFVHFATRKHVDNRKVVPTQFDHDEFTHLGDLIDWSKQGVSKWINGVPRVLRYGVRSDMVDFMEEFLGGRVTNYTSSTSTTTGSSSATGSTRNGHDKDDDRRPYVDVPSLSRPTDVVHLWRSGADPREGNHRSSLSLALSRMKEESTSTPNSRGGAPAGASAGANLTKGLTMILEPIGSRAGVGRNSVQSAYVRTLLSAKIVIVSQRDRWEDHYRLMEALASGALTLTDPMSYLPLYLEDGVSLVVYRSVKELRDKIWYYLANEEERLRVARRGYEIVMDHHRSWHGLERIVFGNWSRPHGVR